MAVLAIFKEMGADENLFSFVFGESIFNDAIGIVMYETIKEMATHHEHSGTREVLEAIGKFFLIFTGSVVIGAMSALIVAFI